MPKTINKCKICCRHPIDRMRIDWAYQYNKESYKSIADRLNLTIGEVRNHCERHIGEYLIVPEKDFERTWRENIELREKLNSRCKEPDMERQYLQVVIVYPQNKGISDLEKYID